MNEITEAGLIINVPLERYEELIYLEGRVETLVDYLQGSKGEYATKDDVLKLLGYKVNINQANK